MFPSRLVSVLGKGVLENNYSLDFDGSDDVVATSSANWALGSNATRTLAAWINLDDTTSGIVAIGVWYMGLIVNEGYVEARCYDGDSGGGQLTNTDVHSISTGIWYHIAGVFTGGNVALYKNGVAHTAVACPNESVSNKKAYVGNGTVGNAEGRIDEAAIWDVALSAGSISALWNGGVPTDLLADSNSGSLQAWWRFEEGSGTSATDSSTNSNTGTLTNGPAYSTDVPS